MIRGTSIGQAHQIGWNISVAWVSVYVLLLILRWIRAKFRKEQAPGRMKPQAPPYIKPIELNINRYDSCSVSKAGGPWGWLT
jgi:hypothetical protein